MTNYDDVCMAWVDTVLGKDTKARTTDRVWYSGDEIFSYGRHFTMATVLRDKDGSFRAFLINGDVWGSPSTANHQRHIRSAIQRTEQPSVIIPFSVLDAAGITRDSLEVVDVQGDRWLKRTTRYNTVQPRWRWRDVEDGHYRDPNEEEIAAHIAKRHQERLERWQEHNDMVWRSIERDGLFSYWVTDRWIGANHRSSVFSPPPETREEYDNLDHWSRAPRVWVVDHVERRLFTAPTHGREVTVHRDDDGTVWYEDTVERHVLGESLVKGTIAYTVRVKCKDCGGTGARPWVPQPQGWYEEELAKVEGKTDRYSREDAERYRRYIEADRLTRMACPTCLSTFGRNTPTARGRGTIIQPRRRTALFLSGFDHNEPRLSYFFCELPRIKGITTVEEAYEALKPDTVRLAEQMGREVVRQGDIFAIPSPSLTKRDLRKQGAEFRRSGAILGTNHVGTEVAYMPDGRTYVRGRLRHVPDFRRPDHVPVTLTHGVWHLVLKNTVPVAVGA